MHKGASTERGALFALVDRYDKHSTRLGHHRSGRPVGHCPRERPLSRVRHVDLSQRGELVVARDSAVSFARRCENRRDDDCQRRDDDAGDAGRAVDREIAVDKQAEADEHENDVDGQAEQPHRHQSSPKLTAHAPGGVASPPLRSRGVLTRIAWVSFLATLLLVVGAPPSDARSGRGGHAGRHHHHHGHGRHVIVGVGPWWWGPPYPYWYYPPYPYWYDPYVVVEEPPQYIERAPEPSAYWYYCPSAQAYYPQTATCQEPWIKVPPRQE